MGKARVGAWWRGNGGEKASGLEKFRKGWRGRCLKRRGEFLPPSGISRDTGELWGPLVLKGARLLSRLPQFL